MLEKIGLPPKPSVRGGSWVIDASHCQGCSSQFTFINRKHHCRRCGGLFCNGCTQQRMILRGQGDSPVRICDPCKKIEEAARFEMRYGHKSRATKSNPKQVTNDEEEILSQILGIDGKQALSSERESHIDVISDLQRLASSASSSNLMEGSATPCREGDIIRSISVDVHQNALIDFGSNSPEELRQQAVEEKKKYKILKAEGKSEEALQAFKHGKELERQAGALEIALRKSRRMASKASNLASVPDNQKTEDGEESTSRKKLPLRSGKEKDDLTAELRNLGWSDADLHDADKKPSKMSLEGELSGLIGEITQRTSQGTKTGGIDKSQVTAHKKKALSLKREGKLAEAKEELKKAKILEKQIEEQELLGDAEDSDDELSALIQNMDDDDKDELLFDGAHDPGINFNHFLGTDDFAIDGKFEVTDDDMNDPELAAALKSFGWAEEDDEIAVSHKSQPDFEALRGQVLTLKREAVSQKQAGNVAEALALLKKAKLLERDLQSMQSDVEVFDPELKQKASTPLFSSEVRIANDEHAPETTYLNVKLPPKSKLVIQKELLALKKNALALRREGRFQEAEEELKKGKVLEQQLEEMENGPKRSGGKVAAKKNFESVYEHDAVPVTSDLQEEGLEAEVTDQDMHDPALLSVLNNLGWNDDDAAEPVSMTKTSRQMDEQLIHDVIPSVMPRKSMRSKLDIQRELLALKRKALALRRQGKTEEADEELEKAKVLEKQMAEIENASSMEVESDGFGSLISQKKFDKAAAQNANADLLTSVINKIPQNDVAAAVDPPDIDTEMINEKAKPPLTESAGSVSETLWFEQTLGKQSPQAEEKTAEHAFLTPKSGQSLNLLDLLSGSEETVLQSSVVSAPKGMLDGDSFSGSAPSQSKIQSCSNTENDNGIPPDRASNWQLAQQEETTVYTPNNFIASEVKSAHNDPLKKDEILARKRKAVALKREGKLAEAREELRQAKLLEKGLEDGQQAHTCSKSLSTSTSENTTVMLDNKTNPSQKPISGRDRFKIQQQSLAHKRNALKLRREGKIQESEAELELAKALENQLEEFDSGESSTSMPIGKIQAIDGAVVEDLLDPQLMSALKAIGWQESDVGMQPSKKSEPKPSVSDSVNPNSEKTLLEEQIKSEKLRALNLKRAGKQAEALEALRAAKRMERKLDSLT